MPAKINTVLLQQTAKKKKYGFCESLQLFDNNGAFENVPTNLNTTFWKNRTPPLPLTAFVIFISAFVRKKTDVMQRYNLNFFISIIKLNNRSFLQISRIFSPDFFVCGILTSLNVVYSWKWRSAREESRLRLMTDGILITMRIGQECRFGWEGRRRLWVWCTVEGPVESENVRWPA